MTIRRITVICNMYTKYHQGPVSCNGRKGERRGRLLKRKQPFWATRYTIPITGSEGQEMVSDHASLPGSLQWRSSDGKISAIRDGRRS